MKNKKIWIAAVSLVLVAALMVGVYFATRPQPTEGSKTVTVTIIHKDKSEKVVTVQTDELYLGRVLVNEGLTPDESGPYGLYMLTVDGETADYNVDGGWWGIYQHGELTSVGADQVPVADGDSFQVVYNIG